MNMTGAVGWLLEHQMKNAQGLRRPKRLRTKVRRFGCVHVPQRLLDYRRAVESVLLFRMFCGVNAMTCIHCDICYCLCLTSDRFCPFCGREMFTNKFAVVSTGGDEFRHREAVRINNVRVFKRGIKEASKNLKERGDK